MSTPWEDLDAFYLEHRRGGELDSEVEYGGVGMTCECGASMSASRGTEETDSMDPRGPKGT